MEQSLKLLALFFIYQAIGVLFSYPVCGWFARKTSPLLSFRFGVGLYAGSYGLLLYFQQQALSIYVLIALLMGIAESFWSVGTHVVTMNRVAHTLRDRFSHIENLLNSLSGMIAPFIAGLLIVQFSGFFGYFIVFACSVCLFIASIISSFWIPNEWKGTRSYLREVIRHRSKAWYFLLTATFFWGAVDGLMKSFLLTMAIYFIVHSESWVGTFTFLMSSTTVFASFYYAKKIVPENRRFYYLLAAWFLLIVTVLLTIEPTFSVLISFVIILGLVSPALEIPMQTVMYDVIEHECDQEDKWLDFIVIREVPLGLGRVGGLILFIWANQWIEKNHFLFITLIAVSLCYLLNVVFIRTDKRKFPLQ
nr:MFS transporter [Seinonella peptonophila]